MQPVSAGRRREVNRGAPDEDDRDEEKNCALVRNSKRIRTAIRFLFMARAFELGFQDIKFMKNEP